MGCRADLENLEKIEIPLPKKEPEFTGYPVPSLDYQDRYNRLLSIIRAVTCFPFIDLFNEMLIAKLLQSVIEVRNVSTKH